MRSSEEDKSTEGVGLLNDKRRQYLTARETIKHVISRYVTLAARMTMEGAKPVEIRRLVVSL